MRRMRSVKLACSWRRCPFLPGALVGRLLGQDLVLAAGQRVQDADQVLLGQVGALPDLAECQLVLCSGSP